MVLALTNHLPSSTNAALIAAVRPAHAEPARPINAMARLIRSLENMSHLRRNGAKCRSENATYRVV
jgi:hypothetical protein